MFFLKVLQNLRINLILLWGKDTKYPKFQMGVVPAFRKNNLIIAN